MISELYDLAESAVKSHLERMHICVPGVIMSYDADNNKARIKLCSARKLGTSKNLPVIENVPISFPKSSRAGFVFKLLPDDNVLLHFCDVDITSWINQGKPTIPESKRRFNLNDCYAVPGGDPSGKITLSAENEAELYSGNSKLEFRLSGEVVINNHLEILP